MSEKRCLESLGMLQFWVAKCEKQRLEHGWHHEETKRTWQRILSAMNLPNTHQMPAVPEDSIVVNGVKFQCEICKGEKFLEVAENIFVCTDCGCFYDQA